MKYDEFASRFLAALHLETEQTGRPLHRASELIEKYQLQPKLHWISRMADEWEHLYFSRVAKVLGGYEDWGFRISGEGSRKVDNEFADEDSLTAFLTATIQINQSPSKSKTASDVIATADEQIFLPEGGLGGEAAIDSAQWTGSQLILVDEKVIAQVKTAANELRTAVYALHLPSNSESNDIQKLADALVLICDMAEPEVPVIDRILASPKFKAYVGLFGIIATIRGAIGL